jgi:hypothetical protein
MVQRWFCPVNGLREDFRPRARGKAERPMTERSLHLWLLSPYHTGSHAFGRRAIGGTVAARSSC